ncbi:MAG: hypothetical protein FJ146_02690 [Deltaproteobacteria bacterium]|nr:hypothetical protein [Deltaproteobacteria bacterium]
MLRFKVKVSRIWCRGFLGAITANLVLSACHFKLGESRVTEPDAGVPLEGFVARDGDYFPRFIGEFFAGSRTFARVYPKLGDARQGVVLIEVKQLNAAENKFNEANLSWSADGVYLGYEILIDGFRKIMLKDLIGNYSRELQIIPKGSQDFLDGMVPRSVQSYNAGLRWSSDSTRFAFMSNGGVGEYSIYIGAVGASEESVGRSKSKDGYATWSPRRNEIAFVSARSGRGDIYLMNLSERVLSRLSDSDSVDIFPEWFPSGDALIYSSGDALRHNLNVVRRHGETWQRPFPLTEAGADHLRPTVSPDGRLVAFYVHEGSQVDTQDGRWDIAVVPYKEGRTYTLRELKGMLVAEDVVIDLNTGPAWSPDSRKVFYVKHDISVANPIYAYDISSGKSYLFNTNTRMNRDLLISRLGILSFRAQVGAWDRVFLALTNQGAQIQQPILTNAPIRYLHNL